MPVMAGQTEGYRGALSSRHITSSGPWQYRRAALQVDHCNKCFGKLLVRPWEAEFYNGVGRQDRSFLTSRTSQSSEGTSPDRARTAATIAAAVTKIRLDSRTQNRQDSSFSHLSRRR